MHVMFKFVSAGLWEGDDPDDFPYPVEVLRVPIKGEHVTLEDKSQWRVMDVTHDYSSGLAFPPLVGVVCMPARRN